MSDSEFSKGAEDTERKKPVDPLDPDNPSISEGMRALEAAYNSPEVSLASLVMGAVILAALVGILIALFLLSGN